MEDYEPEEDQPASLHVGAPAEAYTGPSYTYDQAGPSHAYGQAGPSHTYFSDQEASPHSMPGGFGWPQMYTMLTEIRTDQRTSHQTLDQVHTQTQATHRAVESLRSDQRAYSYALHQLTTRVADLEIEGGALEGRHERRRRRTQGPSDPSSSRG
jgi:hypothetical protein